MPVPIRPSLFSMPLHPPERPIADCYADDLRMIELAEQLGYEEFWCGEHLTSRWENVPDPMLLLAAAASRTTQIRFGTAVLLMPFHNPLHTALRLAQLDHQMRGRLIVGIGSGGLKQDREAFGIDLTPEQAGRLTAESAELLERFWQGEPFAHTGEFFRYTLPDEDPTLRNGALMRPYQRPRPEIAVAGVNRQSYILGWAGERGYTPLTTNLMATDHIVDHWAAYTAGCVRGGRAPDRARWHICRDIHVADTTDRAIREVRDGGMARAYREYMLPLVRSGRGLHAFKLDTTMSDDEVTIDYLIEHAWIVGSVEECTRRLRALRDASGGFGVLMAIAHDWAPYTDRFHRSLALLAEKVLPGVNGS